VGGDSLVTRIGEAGMAGQPGFFDAEERLQALSAAGDPLERLAAAVDFELFRAELEAALQRSDRAKGGRPPYDPVLMFRVLVLQTLYTLSDEQTEYQLKDRLSFMRFAGLALHEPVPDATTIWLFRVNGRFREETDPSFRAWRRRVRLLKAMTRQAQEGSTCVSYRSPRAFQAIMQRTLGISMRNS
jgi:hypothetical protein